MNRWILHVLWLMCLLSAPLLKGADLGSTHPLPNIIIFLMDDMGIGDCKTYDKHCQIRLPNVERLASQGMVFLDAHSPAAVCAPTRYSMLTGNYPWRGRDPDGTWGFQQNSQILPGQETVADLAHKKNYRTSFFGKEHLGGGFYLKATGKPIDQWKYIYDEVDWSRPMPQGLQTKGFDTVYSLPNGIQEKPYAFFNNGLLVGDSARLRTWYKGDYGHSKIKANGYGVADWDSSQAGPILTEQALAFLDHHYAADERRPFLLYYASESCHTPHSPPETLGGKKIKGASGVSDHLDMIIEADVTLGLLMERIAEADALANTLFIFTSDNGGLSWDPPAADRTTHRSSGNLRGGKAQIWEGGHRVPLIAMWKSRIPAGSHCDALVGGQDLFATIAELVGETVGPQQGLDSFSFLGHLLGKPDAPRRRQMLIQSNVEDVPFQRRMKIFRDGPWKLVVSKEHESLHLFNLDTDPQEGRDLFNNPEQAERIAQMHTAYMKTIKSQRSVPVGAGRVRAPIDLKTHLLVPQSGDPTALYLDLAGVEILGDWTKETVREAAPWRIRARGPVDTRKESRIGLIAPAGGWDVYTKLWFLLDVTNQGDEDVLVRLGTEFGSGQLGAGVVAPGETRSVPALIFRNLKKEHAYLPIALHGVYGMPGGHVDYWRKVDATSIPSLPVHVSSRGATYDLVVGPLRAVTDFSPPGADVLGDGFIPFVDRFGQARHDHWEGKIASVDDLKARAAEEADFLRDRPRPASWDRYGGWADGPQLSASGHFRTEKWNGAWWLVDPDGRLFWSLGITCVAAGDPQDRGVKTPGMAEIFAGIPAGEPQADQFPGTTAEKWHPYQANLLRKHGENWVGVAVERAHQRMAGWGVNTLGNWSSREVSEYRKTPYVQAVHWERPSLHPGRTSFQADFPDVFHPDFKEQLRERMELEIGDTGDDPWCIGYFLGNELPFKSLAYITGTVIQAPAAAYSKKALVRFLSLQYDTIDALNTAWGTDYDAWRDLLDDRKRPTSKGYQNDADAFGTQFLYRFYELCREGVKTATPHKLYLGSRIHEHFPEVYEAGAAYADVVSINLYQYSPAVMRLLQDTSVDKPFLIGEFHFGTLNEKGVWGPGLIPAAGVEHSAELFTRYVQDALADPRLVGAHWFQYRDQVVSGRGDGENYRIGFVDITDTPCPALIEASRKLGEGMYAYRQARCAGEGTR